MLALCMKNVVIYDVVSSFLNFPQSSFTTIDTRQDFVDNNVKYLRTNSRRRIHDIKNLINITL